MLKVLHGFVLVLYVLILYILFLYGSGVCSSVILSRKVHYINSLTTCMGGMHVLTCSLYIDWIKQMFTQAVYPGKVPLYVRYLLLRHTASTGYKHIMYVYMML